MNSWDITRVRRTFDAARINGAANHPSVRPWIEGEGDLDLGPIVAGPQNVMLETDHGGFLFTSHGEGVYEVHTMLLKAGRGRAMLDAALEAMRWMFTRTDCVEIVTKSADDNRAALFGARLVGFEYRFRLNHAMTRPDGSTIGAQFFSITLDRWMMLDAALSDAGHDLHQRLEAAKKAKGSTLPIHPDDDAHDRAAGASVLMSLGGQPIKAVNTYNRWAKRAGYALISLQPLFYIDIQDAVFRADTGDLVLCR